MTGISQATPASRLDAGDWMDAAFDALASRGIDRVAVEPLAKLLGVTKGSFYWHFRDRDALLEALLNEWRRRATEQVIARIEDSQEPAAERLRRLLRVPFGGSKAERGAQIELSIRLWGRTDERARRALAEVDAKRLDYIRQLLLGCGLSAPAAETRAIFAYSYMRVGASLLGDHASDLMQRCEDDLISVDPSSAPR